MPKARTTTAPRFKAGDVVILDSSSYQHGCGKEWKVRAGENGAYQLVPADGNGPGLRDVPFDMVIAPGEPRRSSIWLYVGTIVRYIGDKSCAHKGTLLLAPGDIGVVLADKADPHGELVANVARHGGVGADKYARLAHRYLDIVAVPAEVTAALLSAPAVNLNGAGDGV